MENVAETESATHQHCVQHAYQKLYHHVQQTAVNVLQVIVAMAAISGRQLIILVVFVKNVPVQVLPLYIKILMKINGINVLIVLLILVCPIIAEVVLLLVGIFLPVMSAVLL